MKINMEKKYKKRKEDLSSHNHMQTLGIFSFLFFLLFLYFLDSTPKIATNFYNKFNILSHKYLNNKELESKLTLLFQNKQKKHKKKYIIL